MPRASAWFVRTALLYLGAGFTLGAVILLQKGAQGFPAAWRLLPIHVECVLMGWTLQLAMGVAYWILPRLRIQGRSTRGPEWPVRLAYGLLNAGILAAAAGTLAAPAWPRATALARLAEAAAVLLFAWHAWPRVKPAGGAERGMRGT